MNEKRCKTCRFWESDLEVVNQYDFGFCKSDNVNMDIMNSNVAIRSRFGCIYWQQQRPKLREVLAGYIQNLLVQFMENPPSTSEWLKDMSLRETDAIIAIFEGYQKGKGNG